ncbi:hypothetical protein LIER_30756 [Lithospermum erythrorhizon]|uniref:Uncharacterized protein n=1 Tax=Lithospermum erythrorhizon TaxID=34254 RepID=A0AAV3RNT6_LITER
MRVSLNPHLSDVVTGMSGSPRFRMIDIDSTMNQVTATLMPHAKQGPIVETDHATTMPLVTPIHDVPTIGPGYDKGKQPCEGRCHSKRYPASGLSIRHDAGGSSNADLQKQADELKVLLKCITPGQGPVKHSTLLPFSDRLRPTMMPRGFRMPKFKTLSGFGDPSNHLKSFDSQLSFWAER